MDWQETLSLIIREMLLLMAVLNPVGSIPLFASLTERLDPQRRARVLNLSVVVSFVMVLFFAFVGDICLRHLFAVSLAEFQVAGGILLFIVAAQGVLSPTGQPITGEQDDRYLAIFPMAFPLLVGPGTMAMTIITVQRDGQLIMALTALLAFVFVYIVVRTAPWTAKILGPYAGVIIARLLYLFLAAKAVSMVLGGLRAEMKL